MSIATLARKSRAQRGASTRSGWTLATNANGGGACHGPCNGTAPAKQKSFRRLMKNKARPGLKQLPYGTCICIRTQRVDWDTLSDQGGHIALGQEFTQTTPPTGVHGTLIEGDLTQPGYGIFKFADCSTHFVQAETGNTVIVGLSTEPSVQLTVLGDGSVGGVGHTIDTLSCTRSCCPPVATWKEVNNPKGNQAMSAYIARKKQITHNCIRHCIPHREHYNESYIYVTWTGLTSQGVWMSYNNKPNMAYQLYPTAAGGGDYRWAPVGVGAAAAGGGGNNPPPHIYWDQDGLFSGVWTADAGNGELKRLTDSHMGQPDSWFPPEDGWLNQDMTAPSNDLQIVYSMDGKVCGHDAPCDNVGCKCNCSKGMGGVSCCNVHKTMLPLSNSENIPWVIKQRACFNKKDYFKGPRNPNTC